MPYNQAEIPLYILVDRISNSVLDDFINGRRYVIVNCLLFEHLMFLVVRVLSGFDQVVFHMKA
jgi:hypothetical protein